MATQTPKNISEVRLDQTSESFPPNYWLIAPNYPGNPGWTWIRIPSAGNLWVYYSFQQPAAHIYVWHQGGTTTPINRGENNIQVGAQDYIMYALNNPGSDSIKLGYQLT